MDVESILKALDNLSPDELDKVKHQLLERERSSKLQNPEEWENALNRAITNFREGLSEDDLQQIVDAMNVR